MENTSVQRRAYAPVATTYSSTTGLLYVLQPNRHHPGELATIAIATFSKHGSHWSKKQRRVMSLFHARAFQAMNLPQIIRTPLECRDPAIFTSEATMRDVLLCFNEASFLGLIGDVVFNWNEHKCYENHADGISYPDDVSGQHFIAMQPQLFRRSTNPGPFILGVLLHECCHAFLTIYTCRHHTTSCPTQCQADQEHLVGATGHGAAWIRLATHVQAMAKEYLDENVDLNIELSMCLELATSAQISISEEEEILRCHPESQEMLSRFSVLAAVPLTVLQAHLDLRQNSERLPPTFFSNKEETLRVHPEFKEMMTTVETLPELPLDVLHAHVAGRQWTEHLIRLEKSG